MLHFNDESRRLVSTFLTYRNQIDIYTEDEDKDKEFYSVLFNRLLDGKVKINDVTPLGCKANVITRCIKEPDNGRKKIFIVDGDINLIHKKEKLTMSKLYVLDRYSIENCLIEKKTIVNFIYLACATRPLDEIEQAVDYENWLGSYSERLINLFIHFAIADFFGNNFTLYNANRFHQRKGDSYIFLPELVDKTMEQLKAEILESVSLGEYEKKLKELQKKWKPDLANLITIVSGKDYLIPIISFKAQQFKKSKAMPTLEELKFSLVHNCDLSSLSDLKETILALV